ncbi:hypothetical protein [Dactylosporangium sp. NPDC049140]|uniref:hypothetical protein n=1 Tax=Dactylosporangium sp. NPDC049140 TaxID=3155647 RepID=UPI0033D2A038
MDAVRAAWARIDAWLAEFAPVSAAALASPAEPAAVAATNLPDDLAAGLLCHDGLRTWTPLLPEGEPLSLAEVLEFRRIRLEVAADVDGFTVQPWNTEPWWHEQWWPCGGIDGTYQVIDQRPGAGGRVGIAPNSDAAGFSQGWPSYGAYLADVAGALERGRPVGLWYPTVVRGGELWWELTTE